MNSVNLIGRLVRDVDVRTAKNEDQTAIGIFTLAVDRNGKEADFISCRAFGKTAEFLEKYTKKGDRIGVTGRIQTGSYENRKGEKVYTTDVIVERTYFADGGREASKPAEPEEAPDRPVERASTETRWTSRRK